MTHLEMTDETLQGVEQEGTSGQETLVRDLEKRERQLRLLDPLLHLHERLRLVGAGNAHQATTRSRNRNHSSGRKEE